MTGGEVQFQLSLLMFSAVDSSSLRVRVRGRLFLRRHQAAEDDSFRTTFADSLPFCQGMYRDWASVNCPIYFESLCNGCAVLDR